MNRRYPRYPDDADYQTNSPSYYEDLARKSKLIKLLAKRIWEYDERLDKRLEELEKVLSSYLDQWDERIENLDDEVSDIFIEWLNDGTLEKIINHDVLGNKADKDYVDEQLAYTMNVMREFTVNIKEFGVVYDDPTVDNMPMIAEAQDYVVEHGGGTIYFPDDGVLYVEPFLRMKSGVKLLGAISRPVIKVSPHVTDFYVLFISGGKHGAIEQLTIDSNMESRSNYDISESPQILISLEGAEHFDVQHNTLIGNGVWIYAVFTGQETEYSQHLKFNHNHVIWKAGDSSQKPNLPNGVKVDNTTIYFDAIDYEVIGNYIETEDSIQNMTCIEQHGANAVLKNNTIKGFRNGLIVWSLVMNSPKTEGIVDNNLDVLNNKFIGVENGITNGVTSNAEFGDFDLTNVQILNNNILLDPKKFKRYRSRGIEIFLKYKNTTSKGSGFKISGNTIDSLPDDTYYDDPAISYNFTGINISAGRLRDVEVTGNTVKNILGIGLLINSNGGEKLDFSDSIIKDNIFIDCGKGNIAFDEFNHRTAMTIIRNANSRLSRVLIGENYIYDTKENGPYFTRPVNGLITTDEDQIISTVDKDVWIGEFMEEIVMQISGGENAVVSPGRKRTLILYKDKATIKDNVLMTDGHVGQGVYLHLPIEADITTDYVGGIWSFYDTSLNETKTGNFRINVNQKKVAYFVYPTLEGKDIAVNDRLWFELEYPVRMVDKYSR